MPSRIDDEYAAIALLKSQITTAAGPQSTHRIMAAMALLLCEHLEKSLRDAPFEPHPSYVELHSALGKFTNSIVSRGVRAK